MSKFSVAFIVLCGALIGGTAGYSIGHATSTVAVATAVGSGVKNAIASTGVQDTVTAACDKDPTLWRCVLKR